MVGALFGGRDSRGRIGLAEGPAVGGCGGLHAAVRGYAVAVACVML
jgi:hypothetical protein